MDPLHYVVFFVIKLIISLINAHAFLTMYHVLHTKDNDGFNV